MSKWTWPKLLKFLKGSKIDKIKEIENNGKDFEFHIKGTFLDMQPKQAKGFNEAQLKQLMELLNPIKQDINQINTRLDRIEQRLDKVEQRLDKVEQRLERIESCPTIKKELNR